MLSFIDIMLFLTAVLYLFYYWATYKYKTFEERGIPYEKPIPLLGNAATVVLNKESLFKLTLNHYMRNRMHKVCGFFNFREPLFIINDPQLIKKISVRDFEYFPNHRPFFNDSNPLFDGMLGNLKDQQWKNMRNTLTPVFTAAKLRSMFPLMNECFAECMKHLHEKINSGDGEFELKRFFTCLSNDVIISTAFGLKVNSYEDSNNEFYRIGQSITVYKSLQMVKYMISSVAPWLAYLLRIKTFSSEKTRYFMRMVVNTMNFREQNKIVRPDMIQMLLEAKNESEYKWSEDIIVAQCFGFFFASFENNANIICTTCYELTNNPDIQQRLYEECLEISKELNGTPMTYDVVNKMKYMDMVISESLRKWSLAFFTDRVCSKDYDLTDDNGNFICNLKKGDRVWFPIIGQQWDERYFNRPEVFDPERFSPENKDSIVPFTYSPFGMGPRICIGSRYALMHAKAMMYYILLDFKVEKTSKTTKNLIDDTRGFQVNPANGFWMRFIARK